MTDPKKPITTVKSAGLGGSASHRLPTPGGIGWKPSHQGVCSHCGWTGGDHRPTCPQGVPTPRSSKPNAYEGPPLTIKAALEDLTLCSEDDAAHTHSAACYEYHGEEAPLLVCGYGTATEQAKAFAKLAPKVDLVCAKCGKALSLEPPGCYATSRGTLCAGRYQPSPAPEAFTEGDEEEGFRHTKRREELLAIVADEPNAHALAGELLEVYEELEGTIESYEDEIAELRGEHQRQVEHQTRELRAEIKQLTEERNEIAGRFNAEQEESIERGREVAQLRAAERQRENQESDARFARMKVLFAQAAQEERAKKGTVSAESIQLEALLPDVSGDPLVRVGDELTRTRGLLRVKEVLNEGLTKSLGELGAVLQLRDATIAGLEVLCASEQEKLLELRETSASQATTIEGLHQTLELVAKGSAKIPGEGKAFFFVDKAVVESWREKLRMMFMWVSSRIVLHEGEPLNQHPWRHINVDIQSLFDALPGEDGGAR